MKIELHYGKALCSLQIPEANVWQIIRPWQKEEKVDNLTLLRQVMANKEVTNFRDEIAGKHLCVLLDDGTRDEPFNDIFGQLFNHLRRSSLVRFLICTGTHNPQTPENNRIRGEIIKAAKKTGIDNYEIHAHDCEHERYLKAGQTQHGTEIIFNILADDAEVFLVVSDMKVHYFAGYSNPIKNQKMNVRRASTWTPRMKCPATTSAIFWMGAFWV